MWEGQIDRVKVGGEVMWGRYYLPRFMRSFYKAPLVEISSSKLYNRSTWGEIHQEYDPLSSDCTSKINIRDAQRILTTSAVDSIDSNKASHFRYQYVIVSALSLQRSLLVN